MGGHEKDKGREGDGRWTKPVPPQPDPGKHEKSDPDGNDKPDSEEREEK